MDTVAVVIERPEHLKLSRLNLTEPGIEDVVVDIDVSGISTGTERLLWSGRMPTFPGMGYPLVPGYESVGRISAAGAQSGHHVGEHVFVPGARCFGDVRGLFGGAASRVVVSGRRIVTVEPGLGDDAVLLALAATAYHAIAAPGGRPPELIVGHGVLGRLLARIALVFADEPPTVWEANARRAEGGRGYIVLDAGSDTRRDYRSIYDASGDAAILDEVVGRLATGGEVVLAGFYNERLSFAFPPAFMREAHIRVAAEWRPDDLAAVNRLIASGRLSLDGLITHRAAAADAATAYRTAFDDPACLKMILDWRAST